MIVVAVVVAAAVVHFYQSSKTLYQSTRTASFHSTLVAFPFKMFFLPFFFATL